MADEPLSPDGEPQRPALPWILFAISTLVAVLATAGFVYLITNRTTGPVEVLRDFYEAAHARDCDASYELLAVRTRDQYTPEAWCEQLQESDNPSTPTFDVEEVVLEGDIATVHVTDEAFGTGAWQLQREDRTWGVVGRVAAGEGVKPDAPQSP